MKIKAAVIRKKSEPFKIDEVELAEPKRTEVLVKMAGTGVCKTDDVARHQGLPVPLPAVFGHEGAGVVEKVGEDVTQVKAGDRVGMSFYSCGHCDCCRSGMPNMCDDYLRVNLLGGEYADGTHRLSIDGQEVSGFFGQSSFATYCVTDQENCIVVDDPDVDLAMVGPLGCGIQTGAGAVINILKPEVGSSIAIFGAGAVGLSAVMAAKLAGCSQIIVTDTIDWRLELAEEMGATHVINGKKTDAVAEIKNITGKGAHYSYDTTAVPDVINQALYCLRFKGTCGFSGTTGEQLVPIRLQQAIMDPSITFKGIIEGDSIPKLFIPKLLNLHKLGKFPFEKLMKEYRFEDINQAFEDSAKGVTIKPFIRF